MAGFLLSPAEEISGVIDYLSSECCKIYGSATFKLSDELFNCVPEYLTQLRDNFRDRARKFGWENDNGILDILTNLSDTVSNTEHLISQYGSINLEIIREFDEQYIALNVRPDQDTCVM